MPFQTLNHTVGLKKGVKLDFKSLDAAEGGLQIVSDIEDQVTYKVYLKVLCIYTHETGYFWDEVKHN